MGDRGGKKAKEKQQQQHVNKQKQKQQKKDGKAGQRTVANERRDLALSPPQNDRRA
jgi:hypothetical protein